MKHDLAGGCSRRSHVALSRARGLKRHWRLRGRRSCAVALSRARGLKLLVSRAHVSELRRALTSAWIETDSLACRQAWSDVALSRARGLKRVRRGRNGCVRRVALSRARGLKRRKAVLWLLQSGRALTSAWIETFMPGPAALNSSCRALTSAWIETSTAAGSGRRRGSRSHERVD